MKILDEYGKGRASVIQEMIQWCDSEIEKIRHEGIVIDADSHVSATKSGQILAYSKAKEKLKVKRDRLKIIKQ